MKSLSCGVLDTSAIYCILQNEPHGQMFLEGLNRCHRLAISSSSFAELSMVVRIKKGQGALSLLDDFMTILDVEVLPTDVRQVFLFRDGLEKYGKGLHPAGVNFGDLFSYALAKSLNAPLFFQGLDFPKTDVQNAMLLLGIA